MSKNYSIVDATLSIIRELGDYDTRIDMVESVSINCDWFFFRLRKYEDGLENEPLWVHGLCGLHMDARVRYFNWTSVEDFEYISIDNKHEFLASALVAVTEGRG